MSLFALDTDILSLYQFGHAQVCHNVAAHSADDLAITVMSVEEQLGGWYALLRNTTQRDQLAIAYQSLADSIPFLATFTILSYSVPAQLRFEKLLRKIEIITSRIRRGFRGIRFRSCPCHAKATRSESYPTKSNREVILLQILTMKLNVRKMDLRIAAIALEYSATIVTRNVRDFQRVPGLIIEDWTV